MSIYETERLLVRQLKSSDFETYSQLDSNLKIMSYMGVPVRSREEIREKFDSILTYYKNYPHFGIWATQLIDNKSFIGWTCLKHLGKTEDIEVGYHYLPGYWGKGYATEAAQGAIDYGFGDLGLRRIVAITTEENRARNMF